MHAMKELEGQGKEPISKLKKAGRREEEEEELNKDLGHHHCPPNKAMGHVSHVQHDGYEQQQKRHFLLHPRRSYGVAKGGGEIIAVEGGHIVRSTTRKDRHSKVCTAKGPRDRRVRLSAHTAIQFYDVQDRLGYDRPSKAVDWLIKNAKAAIDELAKLPPWDPNTEPLMEDKTQTPDVKTSDSICTAYTDTLGGSSSSPSLLPPSLDSDSMAADTIKSFFPINNATWAASSSTSPIGFHAQDLRLSLQSFQSTGDEQAFFSTSSHTPLVFDTSPSVPWTNAGEGVSFPQPLSYSFFPQRGSLQSSDTPSTPAWAGFASGGFSGFQIPARIHGDYEDHACN